MTDSSDRYWPVGSIHHRVQRVICPARAAEATILAASWKISHARWTNWSVVDCSMLPAGFIHCHGTCAVQLGQPEPQRAAKVAACGNPPC